MKWWWLPLAATFGAPRLISGLLLWVNSAIISYFLLLSVEKKKGIIEPLTGVRKTILEWSCWAMGYFTLFGNGFIFQTRIRDKVDYSKWLGPDWKPTYEGHSTIINVHTSLFDICLACVL